MLKFNEKCMYIGIGSQKSGTTWLADYFKKHNEVFISPIKELHYFDMKFKAGKTENFNKKTIQRLKKTVNSIESGREVYVIRQATDLLKRLEMNTNEKSYIEYFNERVTDEKVFGEITPSYSMLDHKAFQAMKNAHPCVKFIFILRNPVDRFWSHLRFTQQYKNENFDPLQVFEKYLDRDEFLLRTDYKRTIEELISIVSRENIHLMFYEDLFSKNKSDKTINELTDFLNIKYMKPQFEKVVNKSVSTIKLNDDLRMKGIKKFLYVSEYIYELFDGDIPENWKNDISNARKL